MNFVIITDSCSDLPRSYVEENNLPVMSLSVNFKGSEIKDDLGKSIEYKEFYDSVRSGEMPTTSQINAHTFKEVFERYIKEGKSVIYLGFSSALSGCVNSAHIAKNTILDEFKDADITIIDTKSASLGLGLIVYYACEMQKRGASKNDIIDWVESNKLKINHWFTVDDLHHLKRGGRVSASAATIGTILSIKPVLHVDNEGRLIPVTKVRGRRKSLRALADMIKARVINPEEQTIFISHGDCLPDAESLKDMITSEIKVKDVIINPVGPAVGSHSGPGTVALFFIGEER